MMSKYIIAAIPITLVEVLWGRVEPILQRVVDVSHGEITTESVKQKVLLGNTLLIAICKGEEIIAINTIETRTFDSGRKVLFVLPPGS